MTTTNVSAGERVTYTRRFFGDNILEGLLFVFTLGIGWLIWFLIVAPRGQTPAKQLLSVRIHDANTGNIASTGQVWIREIVGKFVLELIVGVVVLIAVGENGRWISSLYGIIAAGMIFFNDDRRALWDYVAGTVVRYHGPNEVAQPVSDNGASTAEQRLRELEILWSRGSITEAEYNRKREEILSKI